MRSTTFKYQEFKARNSLQSRSYQLVITILSSFTVLYSMHELTNPYNMAGQGKHCFSGNLAKA